jgi:hypothetical protein
LRWCCFCHPDQVSSSGIISPARLFSISSATRADGRFQCRQRGEQFQNIGGAVKAGLDTGIEFPKTRLQDPSLPGPQPSPCRPDTSFRSDLM